MNLSVLSYGDRALLVEFDDADDVSVVVRWTDALDRAGLDDVVDVIPAARTVLVVGVRDVDLAGLRSRLREIEPDPPQEGDSPLGPADDQAVVTIPVRYDGPDLGDVARATGQSERDVVRAHTGSTWRVAFGGFAPGFAYLVGGDASLRVPRRDEARTKVPAGSVGLAGEFSGVYPSASPGGWQLIGTTDEVLWDLDREQPALLAPGCLVRFVEAGSTG